MDLLTRVYDGLSTAPPPQAQSMPIGRMPTRLSFRGGQFSRVPARMPMVRPSLMEGAQRHQSTLTKRIRFELGKVAKLDLEPMISSTLQSVVASGVSNLVYGAYSAEEHLLDDIHVGEMESPDVILASSSGDTLRTTVRNVINRTDDIALTSVTPVRRKRNRAPEAVPQDSLAQRVRTEISEISPMREFLRNVPLDPGGFTNYEWLTEKRRRRRRKKRLE